MAWGRKNGDENTPPRDLDAEARADEERRNASAARAVEYAQPGNRVPTTVAQLLDAIEENNRLIRLLTELRRGGEVTGIPGIKALLLTLTWGQMDELCKAIARHMPPVDEKDTKELIVCRLPETLHKFASEMESTP